MDKKVFAFLFGLIFLSGCLCPPASWEGPWPPWCEKKQANDLQSGVVPVDEEIIKIMTKYAPIEISLEDAIEVPADITKINYPEFYANVSPKKIKVENPYCAITKSTIKYPISYLGEYDFPEVSGAPLPKSINRIVGIKDVWIPEPNLNNCFPADYSLMRESYKSTLSRVKKLNGEYITVTNYVHFSDFKNATIDEPSKSAVSDNDLKFIANTAKKQGLGVILYLNLAPGNETVSWTIPNNSWLEKLTKNWGSFVIHQAKLAEETKIDALMINHFDYQPNITGFEESYQKEMLNILREVRKEYSGKILLMIEPLRGANLNKMKVLLKEVDMFIYTPNTTPLKISQDKTVSVKNLKKLFSEDLSNVGKEFNAFNKPIYLRVLIQSEKDFLEKGWNEDMFCIEKNNDPCYQKKLKVDFSIQAIAYEAIMEAIKEVHNKEISIIGVDTYGYWFTDVILPDFSQPQIAQSIRNKPAESIVCQWFEK